MRVSSKATTLKKNVTKLKQRKRSVSNKNKKLSSTQKRSVSNVNAALSRTREVISNKYRKLRLEMNKRERKNIAKLAPLTESLKKIISKREEIKLNNRNQIPEMNMEIEPAEDIEIDELELDLPEPNFPPPKLPPRPKIGAFAYPLIPSLPNRRRKALSPLPQRSPPPAYISSPPSPNAGERFNNHEMKQFFDNIIQNGKSTKKESMKRMVRSNSNESLKDIFDTDFRGTDKKIRKREMLPMDSIEQEYNSDDGAYGFEADIEPLDKSVSPVQNQQQRIHQLDEPTETNDEKMIVSPDDYDEFGEYQFPGVKRSKLQLSHESIDKSLRRIKSREILKDLRKIEKQLIRDTKSDKIDKIDNIDWYNAEKSFEKYKNYLIAISPKDFDPDENFVGSAEKRLHLTRLASRINSSFKTVKRRKGVIKSGRGIENDFIPYNPNIVYEYYDDPNELCDRLRLLVSSKGAGNTNHSQEINSIVEELRERRIVH